jgi:hypothetical protein
MVAKKLNIVKPVANTDRFAQAAEFAEQTKPTTDKFDVAQTSSSQTETYREVFDTPIDLRQKIKLFMATTNKFSSKREFFIQCIKDGLEKYK